MPTDSINLVINVLVAAAVSVFGFLARRALEKLEHSVEAAAADIRAVAASTQRHDVSLATQQVELGIVKSESTLNRDRYHSLSNEVTILRGKLETQLDRIEAIERTLERLGEG